MIGLQIKIQAEYPKSILTTCLHISAFSIFDSIHYSFYRTTMARRKKKQRINDNSPGCFGPARNNTVARCYSHSGYQNSAAEEGTPPRNFPQEVVLEDILVHDKISIADRSCSVAQSDDNRPIPTNIVNKPCHPSTEEHIQISIFPSPKSFPPPQ
jgi:hypothetical protein